MYVGDSHSYVQFTSFASKQNFKVCEDFCFEPLFLSVCQVSILDIFLFIEINCITLTDYVFLVTKIVKKNLSTFGQRIDMMSEFEKCYI